MCGDRTQLLENSSTNDVIVEEYDEVDVNSFEVDRLDEDSFEADYYQWLPFGWSTQPRPETMKRAEEPVCDLKLPTDNTLRERTSSEEETSHNFSEDVGSYYEMGPLLLADYNKKVKGSEASVPSADKHDLTKEETEPVYEVPMSPLRGVCPSLRLTEKSDYVNQALDKSSDKQ